MGHYRGRPNDIHRICRAGGQVCLGRVHRRRTACAQMDPRRFSRHLRVGCRIRHVRGKKQVGGICYRAHLSGAWSTRFGNVPADAVTKFYEQVAESVFNPAFTTDGDTTQEPSDFLWIIDTSGQIHFAPDVSTAVALYPGCSVALAQTIVPGNPATVEAAQSYQSTALTSAGRFYVLGSDRVGRWISVEDDGVLSIAVNCERDCADNSRWTRPRHSFSLYSARRARKKSCSSSMTRRRRSLSPMPPPSE